jgi:microcystin degradation protein MlrC
VLLPGERTSTEDEPARGLYAKLTAIDALRGIADASIMVGYVWADEPRATAAVVLTGTDAAAMDAAATSLALDYWQARERFAFGSRAGTIAECLDWAKAAGDGPAIVADSGDNPTGGGVGDRAELLSALLARGAHEALVAGIADAPATEACYRAGVGARVALRIGATLDPAGSTPVTAEADIVFLFDADGAERQAVVRIGRVTLVLTARRRPFHTFEDFSRLGLDPRAVRLLVVKSGYLSPDLAPIARPSLLALSAGVVDQHVERLASRHRPRPSFPFDTEFSFTPRPRASARFNPGGTK